MNFSLSSFLRSCHSKKNSLSRWLWNWSASCEFPNSSGTEIIEKLLVWCFLDSCSRSKSRWMKVSVFSKDGSPRELIFTSSTAAISDSNSDFGVHVPLSYWTTRTSADFSLKPSLIPSSFWVSPRRFLAFLIFLPIVIIALPRFFYILILPYFQKPINFPNQKS